MANIKSAKKRILVTEIKTARNKSIRSEVKTAIKKVEAAVVANDKRLLSEQCAGCDRRYISFAHLFVFATAGAIIIAQLINADKNVLHKVIFSPFLVGDTPTHYKYSTNGTFVKTLYKSS